MVPTTVLARPRREPTRHPDHDYSSPGVYFVTACAAGRELIFENDDFVWIIKQSWLALQHQSPGVYLDAFVVMPNHIHGLLCLDHPVGEGCALEQRSSSARDAQPSPTSGLRRPPPVTELIRLFKTVSTRRLNTWRRRRGLPLRAVWQRSFHDRIVRTKHAIEQVRNYIINNPTREFDPENPVGHPDIDEETFWAEMAGRRLVLPR